MWCITDARDLKVNKNQTNGVLIFIFCKIMVQYKAFWSLGFQVDFWHVSSVTDHTRLETILEARWPYCISDWLSFLPNGVFQFINIFVDHRKHSSFQKPPDMSRYIECFRADNLEFSCTASQTWLILVGVLAANDGLPDRCWFCYYSHAFEDHHPPWDQFVIMLKWVRNALWVSMIEKSFYEILDTKKPIFHFLQLMLPEKQLIRADAQCHSN